MKTEQENEPFFCLKSCASVCRLGKKVSNKITLNKNNTFSYITCDQKG